MKKHNQIDLSVVVPVHNEELNIAVFHEELMGALSTLGVKCEIIFVDDGSDDLSWPLISKLKGNSSVRVSGLRIGKNVGQMRTLRKGLDTASGRYLATMDGDGQHPPQVLLEMWNNKETYDIVHARQIIRNERKIKQVLSRLFYKLLRKISDYPISEDIGDFRMMKKSAYEYLSVIEPRKANSLRFAIAKSSLKIKVLDFEARPRMKGISKYDLRKMLALGIRSVTQVSVKPLLASLVLMTIYVAISMIIGILSIFAYATGSTLPGWTSLILFMSISFAIVLLSISILGMYIANLTELLTKSQDEILADDYYSN